MTVHTMGLKSRENSARQVARLRKAVPDNTVKTPRRPTELAETGDLRARRVEKIVMD